MVPLTLFLETHMLALDYLSLLCCFFFIFIENRYLSQAVHPDHSFPCLHSSQLSPTSLLPKAHSHSVSFQKGLQETVAKQDQTRCNKTKQKPSCWGWTRQPNRQKDSKEQAKESETHLLPQNHQTTNCHTIYIECLLQIHAGPRLAVSVSVNPCECCLSIQ